MKSLLLVPFLALAGLLPAPDTSSSTLGQEALGTTCSALPAAGTFTQTGIHGLQVQAAGPNMLIEQTSFGVVDGTISGSFDDELRVVVLANGVFTASFTLTVACTVDGRQGVLTLRAADVGRLVAPTTGVFAGIAVITEATGELAGTRGALEIEGMVDLASGLATYAYAGTLRPAG